jgi:hypothetical protein
VSARAFARRRRIVALLALAIAAPALAQDPRTTLAQRVALDWLKYVDTLDAAASWQRAGAKFRASMSQDQWASVLRKEREQRGNVKQRTIVHTDLRGTIPGFPEGEYAVVLFRSAFGNREGSESVTVEREADGVWRVVGYAIR